ncbi:hypothetical protein [Spirosoma spitsbergense]|jgi:hypothetical protein|uniref:hypothetical protein n=1 Tax=Spirosoma spitsbergense TaxID=431554 RepID=UPI00036805E0|nr:hypothetical protein [Spirosoma spitsbergense]
MKKVLLTLSMTLFIGHYLAAQNHGILWCDKNPAKKATNNVVTQRSTNGILNLQVNWEGKTGGSTFAPQNLAITNGTCQTCKPLGAIGKNQPRELWTIKVTDVTKPVTLAWNTPGTKGYCGDGSLVIPPAVFK